MIICPQTSSPPYIWASLSKLFSCLLSSFHSFCLVDSASFIQSHQAVRRSGQGSCKSELASHICAQLCGYYSRFFSLTHDGWWRGRNGLGPRCTYKAILKMDFYRRAGPHEEMSANQKPRPCGWIFNFRNDERKPLNQPPKSPADCVARRAFYLQPIDCLAQQCKPEAPEEK